MTDPTTPSTPTPPAVAPDAAPNGSPATETPALPKEIGGAKGPEPTRYGDWQHKGRVTDF